MEQRDCVQEISPNPAHGFRPVKFRFQSQFAILLGLFLSVACAVPGIVFRPLAIAQEIPTRISDEALFQLVQERTFQYFYEGAEPHSKLARERIHLDGVYPQNDSHVITTGGTGFGVMAILVGIERKFITREQGFSRLKQIVTWLQAADRFHGVWPHWLDGRTGKTVPFSSLDDGGDLVETALLMQGLLCVRQYFRDGSVEEQQLANQIDKLWREVEWDWHRGPDQEHVLFWHWSPTHQWKANFRIRGWNECLLVYILASSSPTHGVPASVYHQGWADGGKICHDLTAYGRPLKLRHQNYAISGGPLFWSHYSFLGLDPRHLRDRYANYWDECVNHVWINYQHCVSNPQRYAGYGPKCWGLTASYSPAFYAAHGPEQDLGVISPSAALSSFPYSPEQSLAAMRHFHDDLGERLLGPYGFYDAFSQQVDYFPRRYLAIDQGPQVVMMENYRTGLCWRLFMSCPEVQAGLKALDFEWSAQKFESDMVKLP